MPKQCPEKTVTQSVNIQTPVTANHQIEKALPDDRYPGSFFRIPGLPTPGKTTWSINS